jgi:hypothetical protein
VETGGGEFLNSTLVSAGDVCIVVGGAMVLYGICGSRLLGRPKSEALKSLKPLS